MLQGEPQLPVPWHGGNPYLDWDWQVGIDRTFQGKPGAMSTHCECQMRMTAWRESHPHSVLPNSRMAPHVNHDRPFLASSRHFWRFTFFFLCSFHPNFLPEDHSILLPNLNHLYRSPKPSPHLSSTEPISKIDFSRCVSRFRQSPSSLGC